jgi:hypothetical protein
VATDWLTAFNTFWNTEPTLVAAALTPLCYDTAPGSDYPYAVLSQVGGKYSGRNFTKGYFTDTFYRVAIFSNDLDQVVDSGSIVTTAIDPIGDNPLTFDNGQQASFLRMDPGTLIKVNSTGPSALPGAAAYIWQFSYVYHVKISQERP